MPDSLEVTFRRSYARLVASLTLVGGREAAEDAVQEAFVRASTRWWRIQHYDKPEAWIRRVAINKIVSTLRVDGRVDSLEQPIADDTSNASTSSESGMDVRAALCSLSSRQRLFLVLQHVEQMKVREIAEVAGVAEGTVKSGLSDGRKRMLDMLGAGYEVG